MANGSHEVHSTATLPVAHPARPKGETEEVERENRVILPMLPTLTIYDLRLLRMQRQTTGSEPFIEDGFKRLSFPLTGAVAHNVVRIAFELDADPALFYPAIKDVVQEQIRQQRTDYPAYDLA